MTKKHFEAMADYVAEKRKKWLRQHSEHVGDRIGESEAHTAEVYEFALYLCNKFGTNFDRARFDAWIEEKSNGGR